MLPVAHQVVSRPCAAALAVLLTASSGTYPTVPSVPAYRHMLGCGVERAAGKAAAAAAARAGLWRNKREEKEKRPADTAHSDLALSIDAPGKTSVPACPRPGEVV